MSANGNALLARRQRLMGSAYRLFYDEPLHLVRGEGVWLFDQDGRKYLDMYNNVPHVGHCHPHVVEAICRQAGTLNTHTRYLHEHVLDLAERLTATFPESLDTAMFCCTGSEANELALRIARTVTGGTGVIVTEFAYHGNSKATFEISTADVAPAEVPDYVVTVPEPDTYRGRYRGDDAGSRYAEHIREAVETLEGRGIRPAAFVIDTISSCSGVIALPPGYLAEVAKITSDAGALFIADEVQPGFGRTGKHFWGFEADDFVPDIVTMGKPMGNGHPISGVVTRRELTTAFNELSDYFNTFGGNPVSSAAGLAVLDVLEKEQLQQNALDVGAYITSGLTKLREQHDCIGDIRGTGLFLALELVTDRDRRTPATDLAIKAINELRHDGILTSTIGSERNILKLRPPMTLHKTEADLFLATLNDVLQRL